MEDRVEPFGVSEKLHIRIPKAYMTRTELAYTGIWTQPMAVTRASPALLLSHRDGLRWSACY